MFNSPNSQEMDDDSAGEKRVPIGRGLSAKNSHVAEVHNLSERVSYFNSSKKVTKE
jgi:hypothetical protein